MSVEVGQPRAKAFFSTESYIDAAIQAQDFAGEDGRLATMPDIIDARIASPLGTPAWEHYFSTNSAEYFGFTRSNRPIIIVAHGIGPLSDPQKLIDAYHSPLKPKSSEGGRISQSEFLDLESGKHGAVDIVDFRDYRRLYEYPFIAPLSSWDASDDPLLRARLGPKTEDYLQKHTKEALKWAKQEDQDIKDGKAEYMPGLKRTRPIGAARYDVITVKDPSNNSYEYRNPDQAPLAHNLVIGQLMILNGDSLHSEIDCSEYSRVARVVGIRGKEPITDIDSILLFPTLLKVATA